jgi:thymidylate synthase (FAD)
MSSVRLVSITNEPEKTLVYIARVSSPDNQNNPAIYKLIKYLIKNKHYSPFEHAFATFEIVTSRAIAQQIIRHRSFTFQEYSQRYSEATEFEPIELRKQAKSNRQSSEEVFNPQIDDVFASELIDSSIQNAYVVYKQLLAAGVAKETARFVLPLTTQTKLYMSGSLRSWLHYLALRNDQHTQKEHQLIAQQIEQILRIQLPTIFEALDELSATERRHRALVNELEQRGITDVDMLLERLLLMPL